MQSFSDPMHTWTLSANSVCRRARCLDSWMPTHYLAEAIRDAKRAAALLEEPVTLVDDATHAVVWSSQSPTPHEWSR